MTVSHTFSSASFPRSELVFKTHQDRWVVPCQCDLVKLLIQHQQLDANTLCFDSSDQHHEFTRQLFLLALQDEVQSLRPSKIAEFARSALQAQPVQG